MQAVSAQFCESPPLNLSTFGGIVHVWMILKSAMLWAPGVSYALEGYIIEPE